MSQESYVEKVATNRLAAPSKGEETRGNLKHGLRCGSLPRGCGHLAAKVNQLQEWLESHVVELKGEICPTDASAIEVACKWQRHSLLAEKWLRDSFERLNHDQRISTHREVAQAAEKRDKAMRQLGLDRREIAEWSLPTGPTVEAGKP